MNKIVSVLLVLAVLFILTACSDKRKPSEPEEPDNSGNSGLSDLSRGIIDEQDMAKKQLPPFDEITVVDNGDCSIKITAVNPYHIWGYSLHVYLENKSGGDTFYSFALSSAKVNGIQLTVDEVATDVHFYEELGKNYSYANSEITFIADDLAKKGIKKYEDIESFEISFIVYETLNKDKVIFTETVTLEL